MELGDSPPRFTLLSVIAGTFSVGARTPLRAPHSRILKNEEDDVLRRRVCVGALTGAALVALAIPAWAHAELTVESVPADTMQELTLRVPEERAGDVTNMVEIQLPQDFRDVACGEKAGWSCVVDTTAAQPVVTFTRTDPSAPTDDAYRFTVHTPATPGAFTLPTVQSYASGTAIRWIGPEDSDEPAPRLVTTAGGAVVLAAPDQDDKDHGEMPQGGAPTGAGGTASALVPTTAVLLGVSATALVGGLLALPRRRRRS
jgi:hypothetical protein